MNPIFAAIQGMATAATKTIGNFFPKPGFNGGTACRRVRTAGKHGQPGDKIARHVTELRLGLRHGTSYPMMVTPRMGRAAKKRYAV